MRSSIFAILPLVGLCLMLGIRAETAFPDDSKASAAAAPYSVRLCQPRNANLWIKSQSIVVGAAGKESWHAQYIYNADRTSAGIFNSAEGVFSATLGTIPGITVKPGVFVRAEPTFTFKSAKGVTPAVSVTLNESTQTISISATAETFADHIPGTFHNVVTLGGVEYVLDIALDAKGKFTATKGYKTSAFVVGSAKVSIKSPGQDSAQFKLYMGDPAFQFPGASTAKTVRFRVTNSKGALILDKDFTSIATFAKGKLSTGKDTAAPFGKFSYDTVKGTMSVGFSKATFTGLLKLSEENVRVDAIIGDITYSTYVTLFAAKTGLYSTTMGKGSGPISSALRPSVSTTVPKDGTANVATNQKISASFSTPMDPTTINVGSFTLQQGGTFVAGTVSLIGSTATFTPSTALVPNASYTATIKTSAKDLTGNILFHDYYWCFTTGSTTDTTPPTVLSTIPANSATNVAINSQLSAAFSEAMDPATLNSSTFTVTQGVTPVAGAVTYAAVGNTVTFKPTSNLAPSMQFTATLTTGATDLAGNPLTGNVVWTFTTGTQTDTTPPTVTSTIPLDKAVNVAVNQTINATFDKSMDPTTINTSNFTLTEQGVPPIDGKVSYDATSHIATFTPASSLTPSTLYTATLTVGNKDTAGNALAADKVWTFTTGTQAGPNPIVLTAIAPYGTFGGGAGMTNQGTLTVVNGDIGTTGASTTVTGFHDNVGDIYTETTLNAGKVNGRIYTNGPPPGGAGVGGNAQTFAIASQAAMDANKLFNDLSPASMPGGTDPGAGQLGGLTLAPGIYQSASGTFQITGSDLTLDAKGDTNATWVFQMAASLTVGGPGAPRNVILINGAQAKNVYWRCGSAATINAAGGGTMVGTIFAASGVTFSTAGNVAIVTLNGRAISLNASTTLVNTVINVPAP